MSYNIIINGANIKQGGALQIALSFIKETHNYPDIHFHIFSGKALKPLIGGEMESTANCSFYEVRSVATDSLFSLRRFRKELDLLEQQINPDAVITVFGPCYWKPRARHIMGFANGYLLYDDTPFFKTWGGHKSIGYRLKKRYHQYLLQRETELYWIETEDARQRLAHLIKKPISKIIVASNNCSSFFYEQPYAQFDGLPVKNKYRFIYISALYAHKNFALIPLVLDELSSRGIAVEVLLTLKEEDYKNNPAFRHQSILNIGPVHPRYCPFLYAVSDAVFMPSMLETFSAVFPEAMYMKKPIVTSDLPFAKDVCGDAALYYHYDSAKDAADKIAALIADETLQGQLIHNGLKRLSNFDTPGQRFDKVLQKVLNP